MICKKRVFVFESVFAPFIRDYIEQRESLGYKVVIDSGVLRQFDRYCQIHKITSASLTRELVDNWILTKGNDKPATRSHRISTIKGFSGYLISVNQSVSWNPARGYASDRNSKYIPYIFTTEEMQRIFETADHLAKPRGSMFHIVFPAVLRVLYGCGLRVSEALALRVGDVDLENGFITVEGTKFDKSRYLPISPSLQCALKTYAATNNIGNIGEQYFFPNSKGEMYSQRTVYDKFRTVLWRSGIPHQGKGKGPRVHDIRHTFAVHSLHKIIQTGVDSYVSLPTLSAYLGHTGIRSTEHYLRLTVEFHQTFLDKSEKLSNIAIPEVGGYEA